MLFSFKRIRLEPGTEKAVELTIPVKAFSVVSEQGERVFDGNGAIICAGFGQPDIRTKELTGNEGKYLFIK